MTFQNHVLQEFLGGRNKNALFIFNLLPLAPYRDHVYAVFPLSYLFCTTSHTAGLQILGEAAVIQTVISADMNMNSVFCLKIIVLVN